MYVCMCMCMCVCVYVCMYVCVCVCVIKTWSGWGSFITYQWPHYLSQRSNIHACLNIILWHTKNAGHTFVSSSHLTYLSHRCSANPAGITCVNSTEVCKSTGINQRKTGKQWKADTNTTPIKGQPSTRWWNVLALKYHQLEGCKLCFSCVIYSLSSHATPTVIFSKSSILF